MSVAGFDLGNESCIVAVAHQSGTHVVYNDESKCEIPGLVFFGDKQRLIGTAATSSNITTNPKNVVSQIKRLIGRKFADPNVQSDLQSLSFKVIEGTDGFPLIHVRYLGEEKVFSPTQILAMVLSNLKNIAEKKLNAEVVDCCIGIPIYFTDSQRRAVLNAASIAGLRPLRLFHETTATAFAYGIYKTDLPENDQLNVAFVDVGHASMQVGIVGFRKGELKILSHSYDSSFGGRYFDEILFKYFADKFKEEYKINVYQNARACIRLRTACEKLKKVLSANPEAPLNIKCLMDEKDVRGFIKREEFEKLSAPILERVKGPLDKALAEAGLTVDKVQFVEVVGSGSHVPAIIKIFREFFGKEPRRTMNASESVACGCALQCAILSPGFNVRKFQVYDSFPHLIALSWKGENGVGGNTVVFREGNKLPSLKVLTFYRANTFSFDVVYIDHPTKISTYMIGPFQTRKGEKAKVKVKVHLNIHGIFTVDSATMIEEEENTEVPVSTTNLNVESIKKVKKTNVPVQEMIYGALLAEELQKMCEREFEMALQDKIMEETKDKNNALEAYDYEMRNKNNVEMEFERREKLHQKEIEEIQKRENDKNDLLKRKNEQLELVQQEIEKHFICPILQEIMKNPCITADGFTYEAEAIKKWLRVHNTSPMTNLVLPHRHLIPNHVLRSAIQEWLQHYNS
ncbi:heat shock 70 kDa protein 14-like [Carex rostrata]